MSNDAPRLTASETFISWADSAFSSSNYPKAAQLYWQARQLDPGNFRANLMLGVLATQMGRRDQALPFFESAHAIDPGSFEANAYLAVAYRNVGRVTDALPRARAAVILDPNHVSARDELGSCYLESDRPAAAEREFQEAIQLDSTLTAAYLHLASSLHRQGKAEEADEALGRYLDRSATTFDELLRLSGKLLTEGYADGSVICSRRALSLVPNSEAAQILLGRALLDSGRSGEAIALLDAAWQREPADPEMLTILGTAFQSLGRNETAQECFARSLFLGPRQGLAYMGTVNTKRITDSDRELVNQMDAQLEQGGLDPLQTSYLQFGLGKAREDLGEYEMAMKHYDAANAFQKKIKYGDRPFNRDRYGQTIDRLIDLFSEERMNRKIDGASPSHLPILVVGKIRCGSTLLEQMLTRHPQIGGAGEQLFWSQNWLDAVDFDSGTLIPDVVKGLGENYVRLLTRKDPTKRHVIDKMPSNYSGVGIIHLAVPNAKFIHVKRDPLDNCLSIYTTYNRVPMEHVHDKSDAVFGHRQYERIMDHWKRAVPSSSFHEIEYECLVSDPEGVIRSILAFLELPWEVACLTPESNTRPVMTPSVWQVRQPIYRSSIGRWKHFEPWLGDFRELINETA